jgi:DNA repair photolyase
MIIYRPKGRAQEYSYLAINHYTGCGHGCTYCYARNIVQRTGAQFNKPKVRPNVLELLASEAPKYTGTDERVLLCFTTDPYQYLDMFEKLTRRVVEILKEWEIPFQVLTKGGMRAVRDFDLYEQGDAFATTMTFLSEEKSVRFEPHAAPV